MDMIIALNVVAVIGTMIAGVTAGVSVAAVEVVAVVAAEGIKGNLFLFFTSCVGVKKYNLG